MKNQIEKLVAMLGELEADVERLPGEVEGHLRVIEAHLTAALDKRRPAEAGTPAEPETPVEPATQPEPEVPVEKPASARGRRTSTT